MESQMNVIRVKGLLGHVGMETNLATSQKGFSVPLAFLILGWHDRGQFLEPEITLRVPSRRLMPE
jgi:hypothetical protein